MFPTFIGILDIQSWWEVPSIAHFCSLFRAAFNLLDFDIEDLEEALLTDGGTEGRLLQELIVRLLEGCLPNESRNDISTFNYQMFLRRLFRKKCQDYKCENPFNTDVDFELLPLRQKVEILWALCDFRLDAEDVESALSNLDSDSLRVEPLGHDRKNSAYWYFYGTRLYREDYIASSQKQKAKGARERKRKKRRGIKLVEKEEEETDENEVDHLENHKRQTVWQVICFTQQDWTRLVDKFKDSEYDTERKLYYTLAEDFLPEIPKLFELKEQQQRRRLLERNNSTRIVQRGQEPAAAPAAPAAEPIEQAIMVRAKMKTKPKTKKSQTNSKANEDEPPAPPPPPQKKGRQTNNSLASADGQIVIHTRDEIENVVKKGGQTKHTTSTYASTYPYTFGIEEEERRVGMHKVLESLKDHVDAWPFIDPVDEEYAPRYYSVVRKPMDLSTMEEKLEGGSYKNLSQFKRDFKLIVDNCRQYNGSDNEYTEMAVNLQEAFDRAVDRYLESEPSSDECPSLPGSPGAAKPSSPYPARAASSPNVLNNSRKRIKKSKIKSKSNKNDNKKFKSKVKDEDEDEDDGERDREDELKESPRDKRGKKRLKRAREQEKRLNEQEDEEEEEEENEDGAISECSVIKSKRKRYSELDKVLPKSNNRKLLAKEEKKSEETNNKRGKNNRQKELARNHRDNKNKDKKDDFEEDHEPVNLRNKTKRISENRKIDNSVSSGRSKKKSQKRRMRHESDDDDDDGENDDEENDDDDDDHHRHPHGDDNDDDQDYHGRLSDIEENGKQTPEKKQSKKGGRKEKTGMKSSELEEKNDRKQSKDKKSKVIKKTEEKSKKNGEVKKYDKEISKKEEDRSASKKFDSLVSNRDLESLDSLKDRISERSRREEKLKLEREKSKKSIKTVDSDKNKKVPSNGNTYLESGRSNLKRAKLKKTIKDEKVSRDEPVKDEIKKSKSLHSKHSKNREESPAIQALNQATEQTLNDINKWLDDAPKLSEFPTGGESPESKQPCTSETDKTSRPGPGKLDLPKKRPGTLKFLTAGAATAATTTSTASITSSSSSSTSLPPKAKKIQRTIDRLQPGKAKGNLLHKKPLAGTSSLSDATSNQLASDQDQNKDSSDEPKLSLGTVLKNADSIQLICKSLVPSPNPNLSNEDDEDEHRSLVPAASVTAIETAKKSLGSANLQSKEIMNESTSKVNTEELKSKPNEESQKPKSATPNLSAWFKAFGAPKSKKKEEEVEVEVKKEELQEIPQRQRRLSAGGSSVSESVSSFSQESPPGLTIRSPQSQPALTPTAIEQPIRAGFYQDAMSTGSSPNNSPYYATPPRYSAQLPPTPSPQNYSHPMSPAYPSSATYDQNPLYPQSSHQNYQKPVTPENPGADYNNYSQNSPQNDNYSQPQARSHQQTQPQLQPQTQPQPQPQPQPQALPHSSPQPALPSVYSQNSPQPPPVNYSQPSPQQPTPPNYSQPSPQQSTANYSQPSPQPAPPPSYSQPSPSQQNSPYSQPSPQPPPTNYSQPSPSQQPNSPYSQPSPKPPPSYQAPSPSPYSQPSPQFAQPSPQPPPSYSQPSPGTHNYSQHSPQQPPSYSQPSPQSLNYPQASPQPLSNYTAQKSPQQPSQPASSTIPYASQVSPTPRSYPQPSPQPCGILPSSSRTPTNFSQPSPRPTVPQEYAASNYQVSQAFKSNQNYPPSIVAEQPERRVEEKVAPSQHDPPRNFIVEPSLALNAANHQVYQANQFSSSAYSNSYPAPQTGDLQRSSTASRLNPQEVPQQPPQSQERHFDNEPIKYPQRIQQDQTPSPLLNFQQNLSSHETIYQPAGGFQTPSYPMPNAGVRPVYPSPHYYDASPKTSAAPASVPVSSSVVVSSLAPVKKRMYNDPTTDSRSQEPQSRTAQEQFSYDPMMALATSEPVVPPSQYDTGFDPGYARLGLGLVGRTAKDQQQLLSIPRPSSKDPLPYRQTTSELELNLLNLPTASKTLSSVHSRRDVSAVGVANPAPAPTKVRKSKKKAAAQLQQLQQQSQQHPPQHQHPQQHQQQQQQLQQSTSNATLTEQHNTAGFPQYPGGSADSIGLKNPAAIPPGGSAFNFAGPTAPSNSSPFYDKDASAAAAAFAFLDEFRNPNSYYSILRQQPGQPQPTPVTEASQQANKLNNQPRNYPPPHPFLHSTQRSAPYGPPVPPYVTPHGPNLGVDPAAYQQYLHSLYALQPPSHHHRPSWL